MHKFKSKQKIYVNESLCPSYCKLLGKCNALMKNKHLNSFYTANGKLKVKYDTENGEEEESVISHAYDLDYIFGKSIMKAIDDEYRRKNN